MAPRYNWIYFFQHSVMNLPCVNINSIIHLNAENIPPPLLHFASAMYYNSQYWADRDRVRADLELESHYNDYIDSYINYLSMMHTIYSLFTEGITYLFPLCPIITIETIVTDIYSVFYCYYHYFKDCIIIEY